MFGSDNVPESSTFGGGQPIAAESEYKRVQSVGWTVRRSATRRNDILFLHALHVRLRRTFGHDLAKQELANRTSGDHCEIEPCHWRNAK